jgi:hypothetical protein
MHGENLLCWIDAVNHSYEALFSCPKVDATQSGAGGSSDLSDITSVIPTAASTIHSTAAQMPSASDKGPMNSSSSMASASTVLPIQKLRLRLPVFNSFSV